MCVCVCVCVCVRVCVCVCVCVFVFPMCIWVLYLLLHAWELSNHLDHGCLRPGLRAQQVTPAVNPAVDSKADHSMESGVRREFITAFTQRIQGQFGPASNLTPSVAEFYLKEAAWDVDVGVWCACSS